MGTYLDAAATAPLHPAARAVMEQVWDAGAANPESVHSAGERARSFVESARRHIAYACAAPPEGVIFTSGGTEANNLGIIGRALANPRGRHLLTSAIEHSSVLAACAYLERWHGFTVEQIPVDHTGRLDAEAGCRMLRPDTTVVALGLANAEVGTVQDLGPLAAAAQAVGAHVHVDAVQAAPILPVSFEAWPGPNVDSVALASHKWGGPQGVGALVQRAPLPLEPILHGGDQEGGRRAGTHNVAGIAGFGAAVAECVATRGQRALELLGSRDQLIAVIREAVPTAQLTGHPEERLPGHASFVFPGVSGEKLLVALDVAGYAASAGSACRAGRDEPSPVLTAMGFGADVARSALRFTLPQPLALADATRIAAILAAECGV